jgi:hypothetical protein
VCAISGPIRERRGRRRTASAQAEQGVCPTAGLDLCSHCAD